MLVKKHCRQDIRNYSFMINEWNKLSTDCVNASSVNMFKKKLTNISEKWVTQMNNRWTRDKSMASCSTCHLGFLLSMAYMLYLDICLNKLLVSNYKGKLL